MGELELSLVSDNSLDWRVSASFCFLDFLCSSVRHLDLKSVLKNRSKANRNQGASKGAWASHFLEQQNKCIFNKHTIFLIVSSDSLA